MPPSVPEESSEGSLRALIYLGASSLSLLICDAGQDFTIVDYLAQPLPLARDVFRENRISRATTERCVQILEEYKNVLNEYSREENHIPLRLAAANILHEASNAAPFLNRIQVANGLEVEILDDGEMTRLIYLRTQENLLSHSEMMQQTVLMVHVGPGNTRALVFTNGRIVNYSSYRLGTHRIGETLDNSLVDPINSIDVIREHARGHLDQILVDHRNVKIDAVFALGYELQSLSPYFRKSDEKKISLSKLRRFSREMSEKTIEERITDYGSDFAAVHSLLPALTLNIAVAESMGVKQVYIPDSRYDPSLMKELLVVRNSQRLDLEEEVLRFADNLADKYQTDKKHRRHVQSLATSLFDQLAPLHHLSNHDKLLLRVASLLHEIGTFISARQHQKHARYIISNTDIFGLNSHDVSIVSLLVNYHRHQVPNLADETYRTLSWPDKVRVSKLASILRIAVALDRSHAQEIKSVDALVRGHRLELIGHGVIDTTIEEIALKNKANLFEDVFGLNVHLMPSL